MSNVPGVAVRTSGDPDRGLAEEPKHAAENRANLPEALSSAPGWLVVVGLSILLAVPFAVALLAQRQQTWYPTLDHAMFEQLVRDVGGPDTPLLGPYARIRVDGQQGSHLGPLSIYLMSPVYRLFGATSAALQVATVWIHLLGVTLSLAVAHRRGGARLVAAAAVLVAVLTIGFGPQTLTTPWNPYLAIFWWLAFVLAIWSVIEGDQPMLPVAVFSGSICLQNHLEYLGLVGWLGLMALAATAWRYVRRRGAPRDPRARRTLVGPVAWSVVLGLVLWLPTLWQQATRDPGNLSLVRAQVSDGSQGYVGLGEAIRVLFRSLDLSLLWSGAVGQSELTGSVIPGAVLAAVWVVGALVSVRLRAGTIVRLNLVLAVGLVVGAVTMARYQDRAWRWLGLWAPVLATLLVASTVWTAALVVDRWHRHRSAQQGKRLRSQPPDLRGAAPTLVLVALTVLGVGVVTVRASGVEQPDERRSRWIDEALPSVLEATDPGSEGGSVADRRYFVAWEDSISFGSVAVGLLNELDRRGYDVGTDQVSPAAITPQRHLPRAEADAMVTFVVGDGMNAWRETPGVREVVYIDDRTPAERAEYERLEAEVVAELQLRDLSDVVEGLDVALALGAFDERVPPEVRQKVFRMLHLGEPAAVFLGPPGAQP
ncbi:hypothetical protein BH20ACT3_BH20ACT3_04150 [soil metagenome]